MATEIVSDLTGIDDLELTEAQADLLSTLGILVAFLGGSGFLGVLVISWISIELFPDSWLLRLDC